MHLGLISSMSNIRISHPLSALRVELSILKKLIQHIKQTHNASVSGCTAIIAELKQKCRDCVGKHTATLF